jgi:hypothetical protein
MTEILITNKIEDSKLQVVLDMLESWSVKAIVKNRDEKETKNEVDFFSSFGMWKDREIDANELRKKAWKIQD